MKKGRVYNQTYGWGTISNNFTMGKQATMIPVIFEKQPNLIRFIPLNELLLTDNV